MADPTLSLPGDRPMNCWVKGGPTANRWHQAEYNARTGTAVLCCSRKVVTITDPATEVMEYRWTPPWQRWCLWRHCRREITP